jgi:hypothetical protein
MSRDEFILKYGWEIETTAGGSLFISHDIPRLNRKASVPEVILWNELVLATGTAKMPQALLQKGK